MKRRLVLILKLVLVVAALVLPFHGASAYECPPPPGGGPTEGNPQAGVGPFCPGVQYCADFAGPSTCPGGQKVFIKPHY
jgi:hypothetical protein